MGLSRLLQAEPAHRAVVVDRQPAGDDPRAARLRDRHRADGPAAGRFRGGQPADRRASAGDRVGVGYMGLHFICVSELSRCL